MDRPPRQIVLDPTQPESSVRTAYAEFVPKPEEPACRKGPDEAPANCGCRYGPNGASETEASAADRRTH